MPIPGLILSLLACFATLLAPLPQSTPPVEYPPLAAEDIIVMVNSIRAGYGLKPLEVSSLLMSVAQSTAETMASNQMMGHIGDVRGRVMAAGYGGGEAAWATENFAVFSVNVPQTGLLDAWSDDAHMIPMVNGTYRHIGVGVARVEDVYYYVLQAAYTSSNAWQPYTSSTPDGIIPVANAADSGNPEWMSPVVKNTPGPDGMVIHVVQPGQTLWSIAIAYDTHIVDLLSFNNLPPDTTTIYSGQVLAIPGTPVPTPTPSVVITEGTATSTSAITITPSITPSPGLAVPTAAPPVLLTPETGIRTILVALSCFSLALLLLGFLMKKGRNS